MLQNMGLHSVHQDINELRIVVDQFNFKHTELQQSLASAQQDIGRYNARTQCLEAENKILRARMHMSENRIMHLETEVSDIKSKALDIQSRSMKDNIVFQGLPELRGENTRSVLSKFMIETMKIHPAHFKMRDFIECSDEDVIWIHRCHRFGQAGTGGKPRPIVAKLITGRSCILRHTKNLAGTKFFVSVQLPPEIAESKKKLSHLFKSARNDGKRPHYVGRGDALLVGNQVFRPPVAPPCQTQASDILAGMKDMDIRASEVIEEKDNIFMAHVATIKTPQEIINSVIAIRNNHHSLSTATHNMYAARIQVGAKIQEFTDDDGEHGGAAVILRELQAANIINKIVIVTRRYSGNHLGTKRFEIISHCTRSVIGTVDTNKAE